MLRIPARSTFVRSLAVSIAAIAVSSATAFADAQDSAQQGCINAMNGNGAKLAATQGKADVACIKSAGSNKLPPGQDADECLLADNKGTVAKGKQKVIDGQTSKCTTVPDFGFTSATTVNLAAAGKPPAPMVAGIRGEEQNLTVDVFGDPVDAAIIDSGTDKDGASCQAAVAKAYEKVASTALKEFVSCKKAGLKAGTIIDGSGIEDCVAVDPKQKVAGAKSKLTGAINDKCAGANLSAAFPGCGVGTATALSDCAASAAICRGCLIANKADAVQAPCDDLDNGLLDATCPQCGNSVVEVGEQCDDGAESATCDADCTFAKCNDGHVNTLAGEQCEDGNTVDTDSCPTSCRNATCGDEIICSAAACTSGPAGGPEQCDLGAGNGGPLCTASCGLTAADAQCPNRADLTLFAASGRTCGTNADCPVGTCSTGRCRTTSDLDTGWTGIAHDGDINDEYGTRGHLNCPGPNPGCGDCIITGLEPVQPSDNCRCSNNNRVSCDQPFKPDSTHCGASNNVCDCFLGAPLPLSAGNTPACVLNRFARDVGGTTNVDAGSGELDVHLRSVVFLGETLVQPCPYCSAKCTAPTTGKCTAGGAAPGTSCTTNAQCNGITGGGVCTPSPVGRACRVNADCNIIAGDGVCTGDTPKDGIQNGVCVDGRNDLLPCDVDEINTTFPAPGGGGSSFDCFPDLGKNVSGAGLIIDIHSTTGPQSLSFGLQCGFPPGGPFFDCPCGVCSLDSSRPCSSNADCAGYGACGARGSGDPLPNQCSTDLLCNPVGGGEGQCNVGPDDKYCDAVVRSSGQGFISCSSNADCSAVNIGVAGGNCSITKRRECFLDPITATGTPDPGKPVGVSIFCIPPTANTAINTVAGIPGPGRVVNQSKSQPICPGGSNYTPGGSCP